MGWAICARFPRCRLRRRVWGTYTILEVIPCLFVPSTQPRRWVWGIYTILEVIRLLLSRFAALGNCAHFPRLVWVGAFCAHFPRRRSSGTEYGWRLPGPVLLCYPISLLCWWVLQFCEFFPFSPRVRESSRFAPIKKLFKKFPSPAASAAPPEQKIFRNPTSRKTAVHFCTAVFPYSFGNAFSYSSTLRFPNAQYIASSSVLSSRQRFCTIRSPSLLSPARSVVIKW